MIQIVYGFNQLGIQATSVLVKAGDCCCCLMDNLWRDLSGMKPFGHVTWIYFISPFVHGFTEHCFAKHTIGCGLLSVLRYCIFSNMSELIQRSYVTENWQFKTNNLKHVKLKYGKDDLFLYVFNERHSHQIDGWWSRLFHNWKCGNARAIAMKQNPNEIIVRRQLHSKPCVH